MDKISYVKSWLECVADEMITKPHEWYHHWTHVNYSGGLTGWESYIDDIYFNPKGREEHLLQGEVHAYMLKALDAALSQAEQPPTDRLDVAEAYRIASMVSRCNPLISPTTKIRLNRMCAQLNGGKTLLHEASRGFGVLIISRPELCLEW